MRRSLIALFGMALLTACTNVNSLKNAFQPHGVLIGAALNVDEVKGNVPEATELITSQFNSIVAENCMKQEVTAPEEGKFDFEDADRLVEFGQKNGMKVIGHCLIWHSQMAPWFDKPSQGQDSLSREVFINRVREYMTAVMSRYKGKIYGWDVVNEAVLDDGQLRHTPYRDIIGPDYIKVIFKMAHEIDPDVELYINDFSMSKPQKRNKYVEIVKDLKASGCRIDGIGMQSHNGIDYPDLQEYEKSIEAFAECGVKVMITELDLNVLPKPEDFGGGAAVSDNYQYQELLDPFKNGLDEQTQKDFDRRYLEFFQIYKKHLKDISRINLWGVSDRTSWLNDWPVKGRTAYPLLFDRNYQPKPVLEKIIKLFE